MQKLRQAPYLPEEDPIFGLKTANLGIPSQKLMRTDAFQRLFSINHSGFNPVYRTIQLPTQESTSAYSRGVHSSQAAGVASKLWRPDMGFSRQELEAAALFHDVGHAPLSHSAEDAFPGEICHKETGIEIILNDPQLQKIFEKYSIDPNVVRTLALEKVDGNPFTRKRANGVISIDHFANAFADIFFRKGFKLPPRFQREILERAYIHENGNLSYSESDIPYARLMTQINIMQNVEVIFSKRTILTDALSILLLRELKKEGSITLQDLKETEADLSRVLHSPELPELLKEVVYLIYQLLPQLSDKDINAIVQKTSNETNAASDIGRVEIERPERAIPRGGLYLLTPAIDGVPLAQIDPEVAALMQSTRQHLSGTYAFELENLFRLSHDLKIKQGIKSANSRITPL